MSGMIAAGPAVAQMDPAQVGLGMVMPSAINVQAKQQRREQQALSTKNRRTCAAMPRFREENPGDPRLGVMERHCRRLGYPMGR